MMHYARSAPAAAAASWWLPTGIVAANCIAAYQPIGAADLSASYVNLANPGTYNAAPGDAPTFSAVDGWTFNGTTDYLDTGITPANDQTWSMFVRYTHATVDGNTYLCGVYNGVGGDRILGISPNNSNKVVYSNGQNNSGGGVAPRLTAGVLGIGGTKAYRDGVDEAVTLGASAVGVFDTIIIGALRVNGAAPVLPIACKIQAFAVYNVVLNSTQAGLLAASMAALA